LKDAIHEHLAFLYGAEAGQAAAQAVEERLEKFSRLAVRALVPRLTAADALLITYGDQFQQNGRPPLQTLLDFCQEFLAGVITGVHILPFFPYSSDDGFSVIDYRQVDGGLGDWRDVEAIAARFRLMTDAVLNHCSSRHAWFQGFLRGDPAYADAFISVDPGVDLSAVVRPRALPLLTPFETATGTKHVWTTFSADQVDLNYASPALLLEIVDVLLDYLAHGAQMIRLDAIAYLWKEVGTRCIHLPQTHRVVQFIRALVERAVPGTLLVTETNVPHVDNVAYFGDGHNEAQLVYNFALPPLALHALQTGDGRVLSAWAGSLRLPSKDVTFFNFLASHDGIGLNPARGLLPEEEIERLIARVRRAGGLVSDKTNPDGSVSAYELNVNYLDALVEPERPDGQDLAEARFLVAQAIMLALQGVPGIYVHSLLGSHGWPEGAENSGQKRTINREKFAGGEFFALLAQLREPATRRGRIYRQMARLLSARAGCAAFDPFGAQRVLPVHAGALALLREAGGRQALCLFNLGEEVLRLSLEGMQGRWRNLLAAQPDSGAPVDLTAEFSLRPYQVVWLEKE
jgi:sucrose phosphorylase